MITISRFAHFLGTARAACRSLRWRCALIARQWRNAASPHAVAVRSSHPHPDAHPGYGGALGRKQSSAICVVFVFWRRCRRRLRRRHHCQFVMGFIVLKSVGIVLSHIASRRCGDENVMFLLFLSFPVGCVSSEEKRILSRCQFSHSHQRQICWSWGAWFCTALDECGLILQIVHVLQKHV